MKYYTFDDIDIFNTASSDPKVLLNIFQKKKI